MEQFLKKSVQRLGDAASKAAEKTRRMGVLEGLASQESLRELVAKRLKGRDLVLASNREPYAHVRKGGQVECIRSAGGLTIALDSLAGACGAVWVCHGGANADFEVTDPQDRVAVPPERPRYTLKRLRLSPEEEKGYYEGFSNETLWPLCHVSYVRPKFNAADWETYQAVNAKFAEAIAQEAKPGAIILLQDYHLALAAKRLKELRPDLCTALFWHIPWPNPEIFRICPWKQEILDGLLANDILGFHLKYHADNFLDTVALELEANVNRERMAVSRLGRETMVRAYPISVDFAGIFAQAEGPSARAVGAEILEREGLEGLKVGLGVDRLDYTKGIPERLKAMDRLFELYPEHRGRFTFVQVGVPSRTDLEDYQQVVNEIETLSEELNQRWQREGWKPVHFLKGHQDFNTLIPYYKLADLCVVSSLHDGMNLVAKEFIAASSNDKGVLVLSRFTGAARELGQALLINPYDIEAFAQALHQALTMDPAEQKARLERMRETVAENNIYTWAQAILADVIKLAQDQGLSGEGAPRA